MVVKYDFLKYQAGLPIVGQVIQVRSEDFFVIEGVVTAREITDRGFQVVFADGKKLKNFVNNEGDCLSAGLVQDDGVSLLVRVFVIS